MGVCLHCPLLGPRDGYNSAGSFACDTALANLDET